MEEKLQSKIQQRMKEVGVTQRDIADATGKPLSLVCYICKGLAHFENVEDFDKLCELLQSTPTDVYSRSELKSFYPGRFRTAEPARARTSYGNPSVRVRADLIQVLKEQGVDVATFVNDAVAAALGMKTETEGGK